MKQFDYYIIKQFLYTYALAISMILAIAVIFDFSEKIDNFIDHQAPTNLIIKDYYINFIIHYGVVFSGLITFISVIFFTSRMSEKNEIIALYNNQISPSRILIPYLFSAIFIFIPNIYFQNSFLPSKNESRLKFENKYIRNKDVFRQKQLHKQINKNTHIFINNYDVKNQKGYKFDMQIFNKNQIVKKLSASTIIWDDTKLQWKINNYVEKKFNSDKQIASTTGSYKYLDIGTDPDQLFQQNRSIKSMNFYQLNNFISNEKEKGNEFLPIYQIEQNERFSYSFSIFIFTLLGFLISNKKNRGGLGYKLSTGIGLCFLYIFLMKFAVTFTINSNIPAILTVWSPNILFLLICVISFKRLT
ncbi:MAG: hypothetical protein CMP49_02500 [Flavobacteriales bacterium]|nr:hypothetical protein [Flavobacteriales bacterium]